MTAGIIKSVAPPAAGEEGPSAEGEPPRTCADVLIEDERWASLPGFSALIPGLAAGTLLAVKLAPEAHSVSIALLSDEALRALNKAFRGKDAPANVLSFPSAAALRGLNGRPGPVFLGDVALAYETVANEALEQQKPALHHAAHLVVHGVLHLAGFDHASDAGAKRMEAAERLILGEFGIPDPYGDEKLLPSTSL
jgi:probable rRNA maturation factor